MTNFSKTSLPPVEDGPQYHHMYNNASGSNSSRDGQDQDFDASILIFIFSILICIVGLVGNGVVICILGFHIKKSPFTTYILNLAVADFGVLFFGLNFILLLLHAGSNFLYVVAHMASILMHSTGQLLLTAISIDRCVSVLLPIWHRCHRPPRLSTTVCALIWVLSCLPSGSLAVVHFLNYFKNDIFLFHFIAVSVLCLPLVTASTMILLFKVFCRSQQPRRGRLLSIVLLTLLFFLIFAFPLDAIFTLNYITYSDHYYLMDYGYMCAYLNSCVNPVIYYVVGRKKRGQRKQSLKVVLQRAFQEEEELRKERGTTAQTPL